MYHIARCLAVAIFLVTAGLPQTPGSNVKRFAGAERSVTDSTRTAVAQQKDAAAEPPLEWVDVATGHRVVRLSREPGSQSLYFHQNGYTENGDRLVFTTREGLSCYNFKTRSVESLVQGRVSGVIVGRRTRQVFYFKGNSVFATDLDTRATREITRGETVQAANLDTHAAQEIKIAELRSGSGLAVNAD